MSKHIDAKVGLAYLEGRLDGAQQAKLERHLADCPHCQAQLREHQALHHLLQATGQDFTPEPSPTPNWADIRTQQQKRTVWHTLFSNSTPLIVAGAAVLLFLVFAWQMQSVVPAFEPAASGVSTATPTPEPEGMPPSAKDMSGPQATVIFPEIFSSGAAPTATVEASDPTEVWQTIQGDEVSAVSPNRQGQVAFVLDSTLFVEADAATSLEEGVDTNSYTAVAEHALQHTLAWSPDGQELLFFQQPDEEERQFLTLWQAETNELSPLSNLINRPLPETGFSHVHWSENGREILLTSNGQLTPDSEWDAGVWLANLDNGRLNLIVEAVSLVDATWLTADTFMLELDCGDNCTILMAYDREQNMLWKAYSDQPEWEALSDLFVHQPVAQHLVHLNNYNRPQGVDLLQTETGGIASIWTMPPGHRFAGTPPYLTPNGRTIIFQLLDENEQIVTEVLVVESGEGETVTAADTVFPHQDLAIQAGAWNPAGDTFSYAVLNPGDGASHVYLWHLANETKELIHTSDMTIQNFVWTSDSTHLYFNSGNQELWQYDVASGELQRIAGP